MTYHFSKTLGLTVDEAVATRTQSLKKHGFDVLTGIDVKEAPARKIDVDW